MEIARLFK